MRMRTTMPNWGPGLAAGALLLATWPPDASAQRLEKHFAVKGRPVVVIENVANGRIEVKAWKNQEVVLTEIQPSNKVGIETEQAGDRIDVIANVLDASTQPSEIEASFQLSVPEQTELRLKTQTGLIYVEQVVGDMELRSVAGDVHLKEVSGYIVVRTTGGSLVCTQCSGKLDFQSISGNAQIQRGLENLRVAADGLEIEFAGALRADQRAPRGPHNDIAGYLLQVHVTGNASQLHVTHNLFDIDQTRLRLEPELGLLGNAQLKTRLDLGRLRRSIQHIGDHVDAVAGLLGLDAHLVRRLNFGEDDFLVFPGLHLDSAVGHVFDDYDRTAFDGEMFFEALSGSVGGPGGKKQCARGQPGAPIRHCRSHTHTSSRSRHDPSSR